MKLIKYVQEGKLVVINIDLVCKFKEGSEINPLLWISYPNNPDHFISVPYLWKDFVKNFLQPEE